MIDVKKFEYLISVVEQAGVDLEKISLEILTNFKIKSEVAAKKFDKVARKDQKSILKYVNSNILPFWITYVESSTEEAKDLRSGLSKEEFLSYLSGIYISIHSSKIENIDFLLKSTLAEMFQRVAYNIKTKEK